MIMLPLYRHVVFILQLDEMRANLIPGQTAELIVEIAVHDSEQVLDGFRALRQMLQNLLLSRLTVLDEGLELGFWPGGLPMRRQ
jgi:hypothetical protein